MPAGGEHEQRGRDRRTPGRSRGALADVRLDDARRGAGRDVRAELVARAHRRCGRRAIRRAALRGAPRGGDRGLARAGRAAARRALPRARARRAGARAGDAHGSSCVRTHPRIADVHADASRCVRAGRDRGCCASRSLAAARSVAARARVHRRARLPVRRQHRGARRHPGAADRRRAAREVGGRSRAVPDRGAARRRRSDRTRAHGGGLSPARRASGLRHHAPGRRHRRALSRGVLRLSRLRARSRAARVRAVRRDRDRVRRARAGPGLPAADLHRQHRRVPRADPRLDRPGPARGVVQLLPAARSRRRGRGVAQGVARAQSARVLLHLRGRDRVGRALVSPRALRHDRAVRARLSRALHRSRARERLAAVAAARGPHRWDARVRYAAALAARAGASGRGPAARHGALDRGARRLLRAARDVGLAARTGDAAPDRRGVRRSRARVRHDRDPARDRRRAHHHAGVGARGRGHLLGGHAPARAGSRARRASASR